MAYTRLVLPLSKYATAPSPERRQGFLIECPSHVDAMTRQKPMQDAELQATRKDKKRMMKHDPELRSVPPEL
jgi:hypothetical protein